MRLNLRACSFDGKTIGSLVVYGSSLRAKVGSAIVGTAGSLNLDLRHVEPEPLRPAFQSEFRKLDAFDAFYQSVVPRRIRHDVTDKVLPLDLEAVLVDDVVWHLFPLREEIHRLRNVRVPNRPGRVDAVLCPAFGQACDRRAVRAIDLKGDEIVAAHAHVP